MSPDCGRGRGRGRVGKGLGRKDSHGVWGISRRKGEGGIGAVVLVVVVVEEEIVIGVRLHRHAASGFHDLAGCCLHTVLPGRYRHHLVRKKMWHG